MIHCAAYPYDNFSLFAPFKVVQNTFSLTASVLSAGIFNSVKRFVYCSSMSRYGNQKAPFSEDQAPKALTPYAVAKVAGEDLVRTMAQVHGFEYVILIPHNIFGPQQVYNDPYRNAVSLIINQMLNDKSPVIYGDGRQTRAFTPIQDILPLFEEILFGRAVKNQTLNIGPDEEVISLNDLVQLLNQIMGKNRKGKSLKPRYKAFRKQEVPFAFCSAKKSRQLIGYQKRISLKQALSQLVDHIQKQGPSAFCYHQEAEIETEVFPENWKHKVL